MSAEQQPIPRESPTEAIYNSVSDLFASSDKERALSHPSTTRMPNLREIYYLLSGPKESLSVRNSSEMNPIVARMSRDDKMRPTSLTCDELIDNNMTRMTLDLSPNSLPPDPEWHKDHDLIKLNNYLSNPDYVRKQIRLIDYGREVKSIKFAHILSRVVRYANRLTKPVTEGVGEMEEAFCQGDYFDPRPSFTYGLDENKNIWQHTFARNPQENTWVIVGQHMQDPETNQLFIASVPDENHANGVRLMIDPDTLKDPYRHAKITELDGLRAIQKAIQGAHWEAEMPRWKDENERLYGAHFQNAS